MQIRYLILLFCLALLTLIAGAARPVWQPGVIQGTTTAVTAEMESWLTDEMSRRGVPGMAIAVVRGAELQQQVALGVANTWTREPLRVDTLMEVASISKVVTALAALREVEQGRLTLDQPLAEYRSDFDIDGEYRDKITLAMLLTHSAGLSNAIENRAVAEAPPGVEFRYSGQGFELAGELIANDQDTSLADALRETVLTPFGLSPSATYGEPGPGDRLASPHVSVSFPFALFLLPALLVLLLGGSLIWVARRIRGHRGPASRIAARTLFLLSVGVGLAVPFSLFRLGNSLRFLVVNVILVALLVLITWGLLARHPVKMIAVTRSRETATE